jgi:hypothetical protein
MGSTLHPLQNSLPGLCASVFGNNPKLMLPFSRVVKSFQVEMKNYPNENKRNLKLSHPLLCTVQPLKRSEENPDQQFVVCQSR